MDDSVTAIISHGTTMTAIENKKLSVDLSALSVLVVKGFLFNH